MNNNQQIDNWEEKNLHNNFISKNYGKIREKNRFYLFYQDKRIKNMLSMLKYIPDKLLDFCCGRCILYPYINGNTMYNGIDISEKMLEYGKLKFGDKKNFNISVQSGENLNFKDNSFDVIIAKGAIHHLSNPGKGVKELSRVLNDKGMLILSEPVSHFFIKCIRKIIYKFHSNFSSQHKSFTRKELYDLLNHNGFRILEAKRFGLFSHIFSFPDIIPIVKYIPFHFSVFVFYLDNLFIKIPLIKSFSLSLIIKAKKA